MTYQDIQFELADGIARLTLNRPDKLNSFTANMHAEVADALTRVETEGARVLVLTGAGRGFCAGQDLSERKPAPDGTPPDLSETVDKFYAPLVRRLNALPMPVVVGVNGVAAGAGANLAFAGDIVIAKESANFIQSFCKLGLIPDTGGTFVLPRLVGRARAMGLAMLGDKLLTDVLAANRAGVLSLMVEPCGGAVTPWQKVLHALQEPFKEVCRRRMKKGAL